jgi:hypothetical protein
VLEHVDAEEIAREDLDAGRERKNERGEAEEEERRPPPRPCAALDTYAARVDTAREDGRDYDYSLNVESTMIATKSSAR